MEVWFLWEHVTGGPNLVRGRRGLMGVREGISESDISAEAIIGVACGERGGEREVVGKG